LNFYTYISVLNLFSAFIIIIIIKPKGKGKGKGNVAPVFFQLSTTP